jgi:hypothetical protein
VQWFERARLGLPPGPASPTRVEFGSLGREALGTRRYAPVPDPGTPGTLWVAATGQVIGGPFLAYWQRYGGLGLFGNPISPRLTEDVPGSGPLPVQYFEHARFELHDNNEVVLSKLGLLLYQK